MHRINVGLHTLLAQPDHRAWNVLSRGVVNEVRQIRILAGEEKERRRAWHRCKMPRTASGHEALGRLAADVHLRAPTGMIRGNNGEPFRSRLTDNRMYPRMRTSSLYRPMGCLISSQLYICAFVVRCRLARI